jgi:hypothetical protein
MRHSTNGLVILGVTFAVVSIYLIRSYRRPENRNIIVAVFKDKWAVSAGAAWMLFVLVMGFISGGFHGRNIRNVIPALIGGFAVAAVVNWFSKRRGNSKEG